MDGYVKIYRKMMDWGWYTDPITKAVFLHLLLNANIKASEYKGYKLKPGQLVIGQEKMAAELGISRQNLRTALANLESTGEINQQSTNKFTVITVEKWAFYQGRNYSANQQLTNDQPTTNQQLTTEEESKKNNIYIYKGGAENVDSTPQASGDADIFIEMPLNDGTTYKVTMDEVQQNKMLYPAVDVEQAYRSMTGWLQSNKTRRKTRNGIKRFINAWMEREQNKAHPGAAPQEVKKYG